MAKVYIYKLTVDDGGAPCVSNGVLSLAICKPAIRSTAGRGSIVLGFAADSLYRDNCLVYVARVTENLEGRKYFLDSSRYVDRPDCIYRWAGHRFEWKTGSRFHLPSDLVHDLGEAPHYGRAHVLLSEGVNNFRYFRDKCPIDYKKEYPRLSALVESLGQGHRVNFGSDLRAELARFAEQSRDVPWEYRNTPVPSAPCRDKCSMGEDDFVDLEC